MTWLQWLLFLSLLLIAIFFYVKEMYSHLEHDGKHIHTDLTLNQTEIKRRLLEAQENSRAQRKLALHDAVKEDIIVHFIRLYSGYKPSDVKSVTFMECVSLLSVLKNLQPHRTLIHTNLPEFWPFANCAGIIKNWSGVEIVPVRRKFTMQGKRFFFIAHEADVMKFDALVEYGGLVLDFDVYIINGGKVRELMRTWPCFMCDEKAPFLLNAGFIGCRKGSRFPKLMLQRSYHEDFQPKLWLWNSGQMSFNLVAEDPSLVELVPGICNIPTEDRFNVLEHRDRYNWTDKIAYHTFYHDKTFTRAHLRKTNSSFGDLLNWILSDDRRLPGPMLKRRVRPF